MAVCDVSLSIANFSFFLMLSIDVYSRHFMSRKDNGELAGQLFGIRHYAGEVSYHAATMVTQNVDSLFSDVVHLLAASESSFIAVCYLKNILFYKHV